MSYHKKLERQNLKNVYLKFLNEKSLTRRALVEDNNMTYPTAGKMINKLLDKDLIKDNGMTESTGGRRGKIYITNYKRLFTVAMSLKLNQVIMSIISLEGTIHKIRNYEINYKENVIHQLSEILKKYMKYIEITCDKILGVGVSFPGIVSHEYTRGIFSTILKVKQIPLKEKLEKLVGLPVWVENNVNLMALGENEFSDLNYKKSLLYLCWNKGIGSALMLGNNLINGEFAGQIGHVITEPNGELCFCGKQGCLETVLSEKILVNSVKMKLEADINSNLNKYDDITLIDILNEGQKEDNLAQVILDKIEKNLGVAIINYIELFDPDLIILNGKIFKKSPFLAEKLKECINSQIMFRKWRDLEINISELGNKAETLGSLVFIKKKELDKWFDKLFGYEYILKTNNLLS